MAIPLASDQHQAEGLTATYTGQAPGIPPGFVEGFRGWVIPEYYEDLLVIGEGAFGSVCSAVDKRTNDKVAIKKIKNPFQTKVHAQRAYREIRLLRFMRHENVISLIDLFMVTAPFPGSEEPDLYIVTELMGSDLNRIIETQPVGDEHVMFLGYQILRALVYVHSAGILHRDLKPSNIAINQNCELKILDFGLARMTDSVGGMTGYVATRWYRSPEVMLFWGDYNNSVDLWSVGCILAELIRRQALFRGGDNIDQLVKIFEVRGRPSPEYTMAIEQASAREYIQRMPEYIPPEFSDLFPAGTNPDAIDIISKLLVYDTSKRLTAKEAIRHPYFARFHDPDDEPEAPRFDYSFEHQDYGIPQWKELIKLEILEREMEMRG